jgi:hypothetical protein
MTKWMGIHGGLTVREKGCVVVIQREGGGRFEEVSWRATSS